MHTVPAPRLLGLQLIFVLATIMPVFGQSASAANGATPVIRFENVPLRVAIENLARSGGINFIIDPKVSDSAPNLNFRWENLTAEQALHRVLATNGLHLVQSSISAVSRISVTNRLAVQVNADWVRADTNAVPLIQFSDVGLDLALKQLAASAKVELEIDSAITRPAFSPGKPPTTPTVVSARWENLTSRQAIAALCENYELVLNVDPVTDRVRIGLLSNSGAPARNSVIGK
jgi:hypothetical protein